jgi:hypothetical protein
MGSFASSSHLVEQLEHRALHLAVPAGAPAPAARRADAVHLVHEDDRRRVLARHHKQLADHARALLCGVLGLGVLVLVFVGVLVLVLCALSSFVVVRLGMRWLWVWGEGGVVRVSECGQENGGEKKKGRLPRRVGRSFVSRRVFLPVFPPSHLPDVLLHQLAAGHADERAVGVVRHRARQQGLARAGRAVEQHALGLGDAERLEQLLYFFFVPLFFVFFPFHLLFWCCRWRLCFVVARAGAVREGWREMTWSEGWGCFRRPQNERKQQSDGAGREKKRQANKKNE